MALIDALKQDLYLNEGRKPFLYDDKNGIPISTGYRVQGNPTIGVGRALNRKPLSDNEIDYLLNNDCEDVIDWCNENFDWFTKLTINQQRAITNMAFQMGPHAVAEFKDMIACIKQDDFVKAANAAWNSTWASQTPTRANFVCLLLKS